MKKIPDKTHSVGLRLDDEHYGKLEEIAEELNLNKSQVLLRSFNEWILHHHTPIMGNCMVVPKKLFSEIIEKLHEDAIKELAIDAGVSLANRFKLEMHKITNEETAKNDVIKELLDCFESQGFNWFTETRSFQTDDGGYKLQVLHDLTEKMSFYFTIFISEVMKEAFNLKFKKSNLSEETIELEFESLGST